MVRLRAYEKMTLMKDIIKKSWTNMLNWCHRKITYMLINTKKRGKTREVLEFFQKSIKRSPKERVFELFAFFMLEDRVNRWSTPNRNTASILQKKKTVHVVSVDDCCLLRFTLGRQSQTGWSRLLILPAKLKILINIYHKINQTQLSYDVVL